MTLTQMPDGATEREERHRREGLRCLSCSPARPGGEIRHSRSGYRTHQPVWARRGFWVLPLGDRLLPPGDKAGVQSFAAGFSPNVARSGPRPCTGLSRWRFQDCETGSVDLEDFTDPRRSGRRQASESSPAPSSTLVESRCIGLRYRPLRTRSSPLARCPGRRDLGGELEAAGEAVHHVAPSFA